MLSFLYNANRIRMAGIKMRDALLGLLAFAAILYAAYIIDPTLGGFLARKDGFASYTLSPDSLGTVSGGASLGAAGGDRARANAANPNVAKEGFANMGGYEGPASFGDAEKPEGCYPRDQLTPGELLPKDTNSVWSQQNPMGTGSLKGKNFLSAGALVGINTVGQSMRNANYQLRSEPPNPQVAVSVFNQSTIEPDANRRSLEIA
jgi:hypothetical protein